MQNSIEDLSMYAIFINVSEESRSIPEYYFVRGCVIPAGKCCVNRESLARVFFSDMTRITPGTRISRRAFLLP
jgi:hypothetical protein